MDTHRTAQQNGGNMLTTIPFSGFYESMHDRQIDDALEQMVSDSSGCHPVSERISSDLWMHVNTPMVEYTKAFVDSFTALLNGESGLEVKLEWESIKSPRYYNFETDRVFATVSLSDVQAMFRAVDRTILDKVAADSFTSCSGFISHYSPNWRTWGSMTEWDHNQVGTLVSALVSQFLDREWEWNVIEDWNGNGEVDSWVYENLDAEGKRLVKIASYLREREERQYS
jgi:hypothetical protein